MRRDANRVEKEQMGGLHLQEQLQAAVTTQMTGEEDVSDERRVLSKDEMLKRAAREARVLLPVHVEAATDAKAAYPIQDVLPGHLQEELDELADKLLQAARSQTITDRKTDPSKENQMLDSDGWPIFAKRYADAILARAASEEEEMVLKRVLGYLTLLLIFYASSSFFKAESQLCEKLHLSTTTAAHLLSRFTKEITKDGGNSYQKTRNSTLSLQYHILLLLLVLHGYSMNPVEVPQMLKISMRDVLQRFRELGAQYSIVSSAGKKIHTVTLLQNNTDGKTLEDNFPQLKIGRGR